MIIAQVCLRLATIKGHSKMCSFIIQHNSTAVASFKGACKWHADCRTISRLQRRFREFCCTSNRPNNTSPGPPHPATSPPRSSETSHPDSCCNNQFALPNNFCTNCQKPSQASSSACPSSSLGSRPDCSLSS